MTNEALQKKINLVMDKLIHLGGADYENDKNISLKDAIASGNVARDFGIEEWDWPQGVGLYGLSMLQDYYRDDRFMEFFLNWFRSNIERGLPSRNINTTCPYLTHRAGRMADARPAQNDRRRLPACDHRHR